MKINLVIVGFIFLVIGQQNCSGFDVVRYRAVVENLAAQAEPLESQNPITSHPVTQTIDFQDRMVLRVEISGLDGGRLQWWHKKLSLSEFEPVPGAVFLELIRENVRYDDQGDYKLIVNHGDTAYESKIASIKIREQSNTCLVSDLPKLVSPLAGSPVPYVVSNYSDLDPSAFNTLDFADNRGTHAITYDGHQGIDFALPTLKYQDMGVDVQAAVDGVVEVVTDGHSDRNLTLIKGASANAVIIRAVNGFSVGYYGLRKGAMKVKVGDSVKAGSVIAQVGSSGYSDGPHVHLEVRDCLGKDVDVMKNHLFATPPNYKAPLRVLDFHAQTDPIINLQGAKSTTGKTHGGSYRDQLVYFSYAIGNVGSGSHFVAEFVNPIGVKKFEIDLGQASGKRIFPLYHVWDDFKLSDVGKWKILLRNKATSQVIHEESWQVQN